MKSLLTAIAILFSTFFISCSPKVAPLDNKIRGGLTKAEKEDIINAADTIIEHSKKYNPRDMVEYYRYAKVVNIDDPKTPKPHSKILLDSKTLDILLAYSSIKGCTTEILYAAFNRETAKIYADDYNSKLTDESYKITDDAVLDRQTYVLQITCDGSVSYAYIAKICPPPINCNFAAISDN